MQHRSSRRDERRCVGRRILSGATIALFTIASGACHERPDAAVLRTDRLEVGTMGIPACDLTAAAADEWQTFAFASGEFEISLPPGTVRSDSRSADSWTSPEMTWVDAHVEPNALDRTNARAEEYRDPQWARRWCVARTGLGASATQVWAGDRHPYGVAAWGTAIWYLPGEREVTVTVRAPIESDLATIRKILASVRPATGSR